MSANKHPNLETRWSLVRRLKDLDDHESWTTFYDTYANLIYGVALKTGLSHSEAQEALQETVIEVSKRIQRFHAERKAGSFKSWLCKVASWKIGDQFKKRRRHQRLLDGYEPNGQDIDINPDLIPDPNTSAALERLWQTEWETHLITRSLNALGNQIPTIHYQIFLLLTREELSPTEVSKAMDYPVSRIYVIKHRVARRFTKLYQSILHQEEN